MWKIYAARQNMLSNEMSINLNILGLFVENWIVGNLDSTGIASMGRRRTKEGDSSSRKICRSQITSLLEEDITLSFKKRFRNNSLPFTVLHFQGFCNSPRNMH